MSHPTFNVRARLGRGGMGEVFLATMLHEGREEQVALKRMRVEVAETVDGYKQFEREARICALLDHENVVKLRAFGKDAQGPFLALEYVDGVSASQLMTAYEAIGQLPAEVVWQIGLDLTRGLDSAHRQGTAVIHRDLSPDNVLIAFGGITKVGDFGIAKLAGGTSFTTTGTVKGKYGYLAPELFDGAEADVLTDHFALAATLYKLWCGMGPFRGKTEAELLRAVLASEPAQLSTLRGPVPVDIELWLHAALSKERARRPRSLGELITGLEKAAGPDGRAAVARCMTQAFPDQKRPGLDEAALARGTVSVVAPSRRAPRWPWAVLAAVLAGGGGAGWWWTTTGHVETPAPPPVVVVPPPKPQPVVVTPEPEPEPEPTPTPSTRGSLWVKVKPWGRVFVDGRLRGVTPLAPVALPAGRHQVLVVNEQLKAQKSFTVDVRAGKTNELKVVLEE